MKKDINNTFRWKLFNPMPVVGILRHVSLDEAVSIAQLCLEAGFTTLEITLNTDQAAGIITRLTVEFGAKMNIGAGTVMDRKDLDTALTAGAGFVVTPVVNEDVVGSCVAQGVPVFPGAFTPTEIARAWELGASLVKVFPAGSLGPGYIKGLKAPLNQIRLLPTGGINMDNAARYIEVGVAGLGISTGLFKKDLVERKDWQALRSHLLKFRSVLVAAVGSELQ